MLQRWENTLKSPLQKTITSKGQGQFRYNIKIALVKKDTNI